jgi:hypothetical protein
MQPPPFLPPTAHGHAQSQGVTYGQPADSVHGSSPPPYVPPPWQGVVAVAVLQGPVWGLQQHESAAEFRAFQDWLMGGYEVTQQANAPAQVVCKGNWPAALGTLGGTRAELEQVATRWSWALRGREYWTTVRAIGEASARIPQETILEYAAAAREVDKLWLELMALEVRKALHAAKRTSAPPGSESLPEYGPRLFDNRELIACRRADGALEIQRFRAGVLERAKDGPEHDTHWAERLDKNELEQWRRLREKGQGHG